MFEDRTYENLLAEVLAAAPPGVSTRQGDIFYDAVAPTCDKIAQFYADLSTMFDLVFLDTAEDEYLDMKGSEYSVYRNPATSALYEYIYTGTRPEVGARFFADGQYFVLRIEIGKGLYLEAETAGSAANNIIPGTAAVPINNISGLESSEFGELIEPGSNIEDDDSYKQRIREKIAGPAENGNRQHYKTWCEEDAGVGRARIVPLFAGENTVLGILSGTDGLPASESIVERVQRYIDPITRDIQVEYNGEMITVGDGLGNGVANIGAHFLAVASERLDVTVSFTAELVEGATVEQATEQATEAITAYLKDLTLETPEDESMIIRISSIGALLFALPSILDYSELTVNGQSSNIEVAATQAAVLERVVINAVVR